METRGFERLFHWDAWANARVLDAFDAIEASGQGVPGQAVDRLAHVVRAGQVWLARLGVGDGPPLGTDIRAWLFPSGVGRAALRAESQMVAARWAQFVSTLSPAALDEDVAYTSTEGAPFVSRCADILLHVTHHGAYHRGQIPVDLRAAGVGVPSGVPLATDYIVFTRQPPI